MLTSPNIREIVAFFQITLFTTTLPLPLNLLYYFTTGKLQKSTKCLERYVCCFLLFPCMYFDSLCIYACDADTDQVFYDISCVGRHSAVGPFRNRSQEALSMIW